MHSRTLVSPTLRRSVMLLICLGSNSCSGSEYGGANDDDGSFWAPPALQDPAEPRACVLTGTWFGVGDSGTYTIKQTGSTLAGSYQPASAIPSLFLRHWSTFTGTVADNGTVTLHFDNGRVIWGVPADNCTRIPWDNDSTWCLAAGGASMRPSCQHPSPPSPPPRPHRDISFIRTVHITSMNHLDVGFTLPHDAFGSKGATAIDVLNENINVYIPRALETAQTLEGQGLGYTYTTHPWIVSYFVDCPDGEGVVCPNATSRAAFERGVARGWINWHAWAFNSEAESMDAGLFSYGTSLAHALDVRFGQPNRTVMSQRDVPGMTRAVIPLLARAGVRAISVGVNTYSGPPHVPRIFRWIDRPSNTSLVAMWHPGGYGGITVNDCVVVDNFSHALCPHFVGDNGGPPTADVFAKAVATVKAEFPNATMVHNSTFDAFVAALESENPVAASRLPVQDREIGDTWIWGLQQDPVKTSLFRELMRTRAACVSAGVAACNADSDAGRNFSRALLKLGEHTWGFGWSYLNDHSAWTNKELDAALSSNESLGQRMRGYAQGWIEQRSWVTRAVESLSAMAASGDGTAAWLHAEASRRINETRSRGSVQQPYLAGYDTVPLSPSGEITPVPCNFPNGVRVAVNSSGAMVLTRRTGAPLGDVGQYVYNTLNGTDISRFMEEYLLVQREQAFGKMNVDADAHPVSGHWLPSLASVHVRMATTTGSGQHADGFQATNESDCSVWTQLVMAPWLVSDYGAAAVMWQKFDVSPDGTGTVRVQVEFHWVNKTATRLPEAHFLGFAPAGGGAVLAPQWAVDKLGQYVDVSEDGMVGGCSTHLHAVGDGGVTTCSGDRGVHSTHRDRGSESASACTTVVSYDAALVSLGSPNPYPTPLARDNSTADDTLDIGARRRGGNSPAPVFFVLGDNLWDTNYPVFFPFDSEGRSWSFRFNVTFTV